MLEDSGRKRLLKLGGTVALFGVLIVAIFLLLIDVWGRFADVRRSALDDSRWGVLQSEVDTLKLQLAVTQALANPGDISLGEVRRRFDILYSRVELFRTSELFRPLRDMPAVVAHYQEVQGFLDRTVVLMDGPDEGLEDALLSLAAELPNIREGARNIALLSLAEFAAQADVRRVQILHTLIALAGTTVLLLAALSVLAWWLSRLYRQTKAQASQMRQASVRMSTIINSSADAVVVTNRGGWIVEFNPAAERTFGYSRDEALGQNAMAMLFPPDVVDQQRDAMARAAWSESKDRIAPFTIEVEVMRRDKGRLPVEVSVAAADLVTGSVVVAFVRDISERRASEQALREARDRAMAGEQAKARFIAVMSHELRTPLNGLIGAMAMVDDTQLAPEQRELLSMMRSSGKVLLDHVNSVLDLSRAEALPARGLQVFDADGLIEDCVANQAGLAETAGDTLTLSRPDGPLGWVEGDPTGLRQVMLNLIGNAVKFTSNGEISVEAERLPEAEAMDGRSVIEIRVADTGPGIAEADLDRIFEDFVTLDVSYGRAASGTGLGLGIARRLVEAMGGKIGVESEPGVGSLFWLRLPLPPAERPEPAAEDKPPVGPHIQQKPLSILVIEDNQISRALLVRMLQSKGHRVTEAENGLVGLARAGMTAFDVILTDISMPHLDGIEATWRIRNSNGPSARARIIVLTAHALPGEILRFHAAGADDCLIKPVTPQALFAALNGESAPPQPRLLSGPMLVQSRILAELEDRLGRDRLLRLVDQLRQEGAEMVPKLADAATAGTESNLIALAHRLAGGTGTFGLNRITLQLNRLEEALKTGDAEAVRRLAAPLRELWSSTLAALDTALAPERV